MNPGEIYMADLGEATPHPVIIVSREELNRGDRLVVVLCTSQKLAVRSALPHCVPFQAGQFGFTKGESATRLPAHGTRPVSLRWTSSLTRSGTL